ncbi:MAG TPA: hypothetical protein VLE89_05835 [Chlamydiales bacterium]|nr:hypothetical protein [Chlamydiales bacterium]
MATALEVYREKFRSALGRPEPESYPHQGVVELQAIYVELSSLERTTPKACFLFETAEKAAACSLVINRLAAQASYLGNDEARQSDFNRADLLEVLAAPSVLVTADETRTICYQAKTSGTVGKPIATTRELIDKICTALKKSDPRKKLDSFVPIYAIYA